MQFLSTIFFKFFSDFFQKFFPQFFLLFFSTTFFLFVLVFYVLIQTKNLFHVFSLCLYDIKQIANLFMTKCPLVSQKYMLVLSQCLYHSNNFWVSLLEMTNFCNKLVLSSILAQYLPNFWVSLLEMTNFKSMRLLPCPSHNSGSQGLYIFAVSLAPRKIIFSKNFTVMTTHNWGPGVITVTFFDKMSYHGARVKIKKWYG